MSGLTRWLWIGIISFLIALAVLLYVQWEWFKMHGKAIVTILAVFVMAGGAITVLSACIASLDED